MANRKNRFLLKRSNVPNKIPVAGDLLLGELALNIADVKLYASGTTTNSILQIGWDRVSRTGDTMSGPLYAPIISGGTYLGLDIDGTLSANSNTIISSQKAIKTYVDSKVVTGSSFSISGTTNYIPKFNSSSGQTISRLFDNGTKLGIDTPTPTKDITFGNQLDREIGVEAGSTTGIGRDLILSSAAAGIANVVTPTPNSNFVGLGQTTRFWQDIVILTNGDIYATVSGGDIYKQTGGAGNFIALGQTPRDWAGIDVSPNGDVYCVVPYDDVYKQTGGIGNFVALGQGARSWRYVVVLQNGDVYATAGFEGIYKQTGGIGNFVNINETVRNWYGIDVKSNGDIYACVRNGDIYKQTGGVGSFIGLSQTVRDWEDISISPNGDIYSTDKDAGRVYRQTGGTGNFIDITTTLLPLKGLTTATNGDVYSVAFNGDIYIKPFSTSSPTQNLNSGILKIKAGLAKGTGTSKIEFYTGQKTVSGTTTQVETLRGSIDENGNWNIVNKLLIGTSTSNTVTKDLGLGNKKNGEIGVEPTTISLGKDLTVSAGSTSGTLVSFLSQFQGTKNWRGMATNSSGDIYAVVTFNGDIYKKTGGVGNFVGLSQTSRNWEGITITPSGDVYATVSGGDIYKQTGGVGNFVGLSQTSRNWEGVTSTLNGDVYACVNGGDIYKQTGGVGNFVALGQTSRNWSDITVAPNGDIYACVNGGDIYKQTGGVGSFVALGQTIAFWRGLTSFSNGDIYATVFAGNIYKQTGGIGGFVILDDTIKNWEGITITPSGDVYATVGGEEIYRQTTTVSNLNAGILKLKSGLGKGTGSNKIEFYTGQKGASGSNVQVDTLRGSIDENGIWTILGNVNVVGTLSATILSTVQRAITNVTLAVNTARLPSLIQDVEVIIIFQQTSTDGVTSSANLQVDTSGNGVFVTVATSEQNANVSGIGIGITFSSKNTITKIIPMGSQYRWTTTGTPATVISIKETTL